MVRKIAENTRLPYFSITPTFSVCKEHGYIKGEKYNCPTCGKETEVYSRIVGYFRPVKQWNNGKREEFKDRLEYTEGKSLKSQFRVKVTTTGETVTEAEEQQLSCITSGIPQKYKIFTLPNCDKCRTAKEYLGGIKIAGEILDLASKDDLRVFREYYKELKNVIKRNEDGSLPVPTVLFFDEKDNVIGTAHNVDDIKKVIQ